MLGKQQWLREAKSARSRHDHGLAALTMVSTLLLSLVACQQAIPTSRAREAHLTADVSAPPWGRQGDHAAPPELAQKAPVDKASLFKKSNVHVLSSLYLRYKLTEDERDAIRIYTWGERKVMSGCPRKSLEEARCAAMRLGKNRPVPSFCEAMDAAFKKLPPSPGIVYRGAYAIKVAEVRRLYEGMKSKKPLTLGEGRWRTWASASRYAELAYELFMNYYDQTENDYKLFYVIDQRSGISIENLSKFPEQQEVLLPPSARYIVRDMAPIKGTAASVMVSLVEEPGVAPQSLFTSLCQCVRGDGAPSYSVR